MWGFILLVLLFGSLPCSVRRLCGRYFDLNMLQYSDDEDDNNIRGSAGRYSSSSRGTAKSGGRRNKDSDEDEDEGRAHTQVVVRKSISSNANRRTSASMNANGFLRSSGDSSADRQSSFGGPESRSFSRPATASSNPRVSSDFDSPPLRGSSGSSSQRGTMSRTYDDMEEESQASRAQQSRPQRYYQDDDVDYDAPPAEVHATGRRYTSSNELWNPSKPQSQQQNATKGRETNNADEDYGTTFTAKSSRKQVEGAPIRARDYDHPGAHGDLEEFDRQRNEYNTNNHSKSWAQQQSPTTRTSTESEEGYGNRTKNANSSSGSWSTARMADEYTRAQMGQQQYGTSTQQTRSGHQGQGQGQGQVLGQQGQQQQQQQSSGSAFERIQRGFGSKQEFESSAAQEGELARQSYETFSAFLREEEAKGRSTKKRGKKPHRDGHDSDEADLGVDGDETQQTHTSSSAGGYSGRRGAGAGARAGGDDWGFASMEAAYGLDEATEVGVERIPFPLRAHPRGHNSALVQCVVRRDRSTTHTSYELWLESPERKLIVAEKMTMNRTSNYHFFDMTRGHIEGSKLTKKSGNYLGKLRSLNASKTEYVLLTHNANEKEEVCAVTFEQQRVVDLLSANAQPRKMCVCVPHIDSRKVPIPNKLRESAFAHTSTHALATAFTSTGSTHTQAHTNSLMDVIKQNQMTNRALKFTNKQPVFENGNYRLNFNGRVSKASVKNFQLVSVDDEHSDTIVCQFGKVENDRYTLDYRAPLNAFQAFSLAVCQFNM